MQDERGGSLRQAYEAAARAAGATPAATATPTATPAATPAATEHQLVELWRRGQAAWPEVALDGESFARYLGERSRAGDAPLDVRAEDLFLACACVRGDAAALRCFEREYLSRIGQHLGDMGRDAVLVDEVTQELRERLLCGTAAAPAQLGGYTGRGGLHLWLRITALRLSWKRREQARRHAPLLGEPAADRVDLAGALGPEVSPELRYLKDRYRADFATAIGDAFLLLSSKQRNLLRLRHLQGLTDERIGALYRVHQSTVTRWMGGLHAELLRTTQRLLRERLGLSPEQLESLLGVVRSQLEVSLEGMLRRTIA